MIPTYLLLELGATAFFVIAGWLALRRGRLPFLELASAAAFGLLLEEGDQLIFGTYNYSPDFTLAIHRAPVVIGLTWALIIAGSMRITDALGVRRAYAPFVDAILAISLDLAFDAIAIRMGLWTWRDIGFDQGWFGVPAGNFYAWLFVTLGFSLVSRALRHAAHRRPALEWLQLAVPLPAFAILLGSLVPFTILQPIIDPGPGAGWPIFIATMVGFLAIGAAAVWGPDRGVPDGAADAILDLRLAFATRVAIHLVFLFAFLSLGLLKTVPLLGGVALVMLLLELPLAAMAQRRLAGRREPRRAEPGMAVEA